MTRLSFATLREANTKRLPQFKPAHAMRDGSDWTPSDWLQAVVGELGEYANKRKKFIRGDISLEEFTVYAKQELADVMIYLDILAMRCLDTPTGPHLIGVDLAEAVVETFNAKSKQVGSNVFVQRDVVVHGPVDARFSFGDLVRYGEGRTALMMVTGVSKDHGGAGIDYYHGEQCMGGVISQYMERLVAATHTDLVIWRECAKYRRG